MAYGERFNPYLRFKKNALIPEWLCRRPVSEISYTAKVCYGTLRRAAGENGRCWWAAEKIGAAMGCSRRQALRALHELRDLGLIEIADERDRSRGRFTVNVFHFLTHPWMDEATDDDTQDDRVTDPAHGQDATEGQIRHTDRVTDPAHGDGQIRHTVMDRSGTRSRTDMAHGLPYIEEVPSNQVHSKRARSKQAQRAERASKASSTHSGETPEPPGGGGERTNKSNQSEPRTAAGNGPGGYRSPRPRAEVDPALLERIAGWVLPRTINGGKDNAARRSLSIVLGQHANLAEDERPSLEDAVDEAFLIAQRLEVEAFGTGARVRFGTFLGVFRWRATGKGDSSFYVERKRAEQLLPEIQNTIREIRKKQQRQAEMECLMKELFPEPCQPVPADRSVGC